MNRFALADALRDGLHNGGCEGVSRDVRFAVHALTAFERGKLAALLGVYGYVHLTDVQAATGLTPGEVAKLHDDG